MIRNALQALTTLAERQPAARPAIGALLPRFVSLLDGMAADGEGTFQYPALYAAVGHLALILDEAATAEPLLRRAIALDPHQPSARVMLAIAVIVQERDASREINHAVNEALNPIWVEGPFLDAAAVLQEMAISALRYSQLFPARGPSLQPLMAAVAAAQRQLEGGA